VDGKRQAQSLDWDINREVLEMYSSEFAEERHQWINNYDIMQREMPLHGIPT
jgi:hypothetical protein